MLFVNLQFLVILVKFNIQSAFRRVLKFGIWQKTAPKMLMKLITGSHIKLTNRDMIGTLP
jgi:hypothetical protein